MLGWGVGGYGWTEAQPPWPDFLLKIPSRVNSERDYLAGLVDLLDPVHGMNEHNQAVFP